MTDDVLDVTVQRADGGAMHLTNDTPLDPVASNVGTWLRHWAEVAPDRTLLAETAGGGWRRLTYGDALASARHAAMQLDAVGGDAPRVLVLPGNGIEHLRVALGCLLVGIPYTPVSTSMATGRDGFAGLRRVMELLKPTVVVAGPDHAAAIEVATQRSEIAVVEGDSLDKPHPDIGPLDREAEVGPSSVAKLLLTSGSTGTPKAVPTTHRMLVANQAQLAAVWPFLVDEPPVLVDWLPWSHTFGGSHNVGIVLRNGGTMYLDPGGPTADGAAVSLATATEIRPTMHFNVPAGYQALLPHMRNDPDAAAAFFDRVRVLFNASAALTPRLREAWTRLARKHAPRDVLIQGGYGATETAPAALVTRPGTTDARSIGVPLPQVEVRLDPVADAHEILLKGPNVFAGYLDDPEQTSEVLEPGGWYRTGDLVTLVDPTSPEEGLVFAGRSAENFKLSTGTWVRVPQLREAVLDATDPLLRDVVIAGHDRDDVRVLAWVSESHASRPGLREELRKAVTTYNQAAGGSSRRVAALLLLEQPPSDDEVTDKGAISQRRVLQNRQDAVRRLYATSPQQGRIELTGRAGGQTPHEPRS